MLNRGYCHDTESHSSFLARSISLTNFTTTSGFKGLPNFMQLSQLEVEICNEIICCYYYCQCCRLNHTLLSSSAHCRLDSMINIQAIKVKITFGRVGKEIGTFDSSAHRERERERERESQSICVPCQLPVFHSRPCLRLAQHHLH